MLKRLAIIFTVVVAATAGVVSYSLKDNPARIVSGHEKIIERHGMAIQYFISGPEHGETLVLQASYARSGSDFNELVAHLNRAGYRTLIMQARGVDGTGLPSLRTTLFDYADDLAAVISVEGIRQPFTMIGHAFGNRIARAFSSRHPDSVRSLVLLAAGDSAPPPEVRNAIFKILVKIWPESSRSTALHQAFFAPGNQAPRYWVKGWYPRAGLAQGRATATTKADQWAHGGTAEMLII